jgi:NADH-quinone oxidoreductase subunit M
MLCIKNLLSYILLLPLLGAISLIPVPSSNQSLLKQIALGFSCLTFVLSLFVWVFFNKSVGTFQFVNKFFWIPILNLNFPLGVDGISLFFLLLTTLLIPLCLLTSWGTIKTDLKKYLISFLVMEFFLIGVFCVLHLLLFYI